ncbi:hypothetical protein PN441_06695 [Spirulina major CS-329]|uniref:hypothetical protein n=1 Tax=Spirulina TaxID=1154 RepID=UPI00232CE1F1|nr:MULTISPECIES: hypothetical protein [Spirulina]MDB9496137.1 hypothetical protein [Spirulina subsalsa CS-330]MDB9502755.1 hypothetical protein [Spirulina major CS-329]
MEYKYIVTKLNQQLQLLFPPQGNKVKRQQLISWGVPELNLDSCSMPGKAVKYLNASSCFLVCRVSPRHWEVLPIPPKAVQYTRSEIVEHLRLRNGELSGISTGGFLSQGSYIAWREKHRYWLLIERPMCMSA